MSIRAGHGAVVVAGALGEIPGEAGREVVGRVGGEVGAVGLRVGRQRYLLAVIEIGVVVLERIVAGRRPGVGSRVEGGHAWGRGMRGGWGWESQAMGGGG